MKWFWTEGKFLCGLF